LNLLTATAIVVGFLPTNISSVVITNVWIRCISSSVKGEKVHLCLRQREGPNETLVNENIMVFVSLHEMAHVITPTVGHGPDFWNNFAWLLKQAEERGIYHYQDFKAHPVAYCGLNITDSPSYDPKKDGSDLSVGK
jgi:hypothetical protein